jgi:type III restriction enzyme
VGELDLIDTSGIVVQCELVLMTDWKTRLPSEFLA